MNRAVMLAAPHRSPNLPVLPTKDLLKDNLLPKLTKNRTCWQVNPGGLGVVSFHAG